MPYYVVDAFAQGPFTGNPAAVCLLDEWPAAPLLQSIAAEFNLSETAFLKREGKGWDIRWFTPRCEVELCGHATLAAAHVLIRERGEAAERVDFVAGMGPLSASAIDVDKLELDFPSDPPRPVSSPASLTEALGAVPREVLSAADLVCVYDEEATVSTLVPKIRPMLALPGRGVVVTAPGRDCDFVSRFFAPKVGVAEDPVTGSTHTELVPYWAARLGRRKMNARQLSLRGGILWLEDRAERVGIGGQAVTVAVGSLRTMGYDAVMQPHRPRTA